MIYATTGKRFGEIYVQISPRAGYLFRRGVSVEQRNVSCWASREVASESWGVVYLVNNECQWIRERAR
jgi:hypothetical protein